MIHSAIRTLTTLFILCFAGLAAAEEPKKCHCSCDAHEQSYDQFLKPKPLLIAPRFSDGYDIAPNQTWPYSAKDGCPAGTHAVQVDVFPYAYLKWECRRDPDAQMWFGIGVGIRMTDQF